MVNTRAGGQIEIDISDEACSEFKIPDEKGKTISAKTDMKIVDPFFGNGKIIGVGRNICDCGCCDSDGTKKVLWIALDCHNGKACFSDPIDFITV